MSDMTSAASDEELAMKAQAGSRPSFEELVDRYSGRLFCFLRPKIASGQDIEDILQEAFLKAYKNIDGYNPQWKFSTWIYTITNRLAIDHFRAQAKGDGRILPEEIQSNPEDEYVEHIARQNLWWKARKLKPDYYMVLWMRYVQGMTNKEIARVMGRTSLAVRMLVHRARLNLAEKLESEKPEEQEKAHPALDKAPGFYYGGE
jgi:RNA polymerase sigma-70 factor, ECF subfamily